jgi:hypothetical protein
LRLRSLAFHLLPDSVVVKVPVEPAVGDAVMWCASESMFISSTPRLTVSRMFNLHRPSLRPMVLLLSLPLLNRILFLMQVLLRDGPGELVGTMDHNWLCILHRRLCPGSSMGERLCSASDVCLPHVIILGSLTTWYWLAPSHPITPFHAQGRSYCVHWDMVHIHKIHDYLSALYC